MGRKHKVIEIVLLPPSQDDEDDEEIIPLPPVMPLCWDSHADWVEWNVLNDASAIRAANRGRRDKYCVDCTAEYQQKMEQQNRCAYPKKG